MFNVFNTLKTLKPPLIVALFTEMQFMVLNYTHNLYILCTDVYCTVHTMLYK